MDEGIEPRQACETEDILARFAPHVIALRKSVRKLGAKEVSSLLAEVLLNFFTGEPTDSLPAEVASILGPTATRQVQECRPLLLTAELKEDFASQLGQIGSHWLIKAERGRRVPAYVQFHTRGRIQLDIEGKIMPIPRLNRVYDWGSWPDSEGELEHTILDLARFEYISKELGKTISSMKQIAKSNAYRTLGAEMDIAGWIRAGDGVSLELFVRDCIERAGFSCTRAPLYEDLLEATDLRVTLPDIDRNRGVRVQVSWIAEFALFKRKRYLIPHASTVVFLSPFTLAQRWRWEQEDSATAGFPYDRQDEDEAAARAIQAQLAKAVNFKPYPTLGPAESAPSELVRLIGDFVEREGRRCHAKLRSIQEQRPAYGSRAENVRDRMIMRLRVRNDIMSSPQVSNEPEG